MTTNIYVSIPKREVVSGFNNNAGINSGTSSTSADWIELRVMTVDGSTATGVTKRDVIQAMEAVFKRWIKEGGLIGNGTNVPIL